MDSAITIDERSMLKQFFRDSGPQFAELEDVQIDEFCSRLQSVVCSPGTILKQSDEECERFYVLIKGKVSVYCPEHTSKQLILVNDYNPG